MDTLPILEKRKMAEQFPNLSDDEKVLAFIQTEYPSLTESQRKREFEKRYSFNQDGLSPEDIELETAKINDRKKRDAQTATEYFTKNIPELKLPTFEPPKPAVQELSEQQKQIMQFGSSFNEDKISKFPFEFNAAEKNIAVKGEVVLPDEKITELESKIAQDPESFLAGFVLSRYGTPDKQVNAKALARDILFLNEPALWGNQIAKDTLEQTYLERLKQERHYEGDRNVGGGNTNLSKEQAERAGMYKAFGVEPPAES